MYRVRPDGVDLRQESLRGLITGFYAESILDCQYAAETVGVCTILLELMLRNKMEATNSTSRRYVQNAIKSPGALMFIPNLLEFPTVSSRWHPSL